MCRKLASIRVLSRLEPILNADKIELAKIDNWQVIVKKGDFKENSLVVFLEIDSFIPNTIAPFLTRVNKLPNEFNNIKGERLRTIKLRGVLSQGLVLPLTVLDPSFTISEGIDVTEQLGVVKYDPPISAQLSGLAKGNFPSFIQKTDQERIQNLPKLFEEEKYTRWEVTLKLDGSSCTAYLLEGKKGVCSRNLELKLDDGNENNSFVKAATDSLLLDSLLGLYYNIAVQGELMGPGIQGNREGLIIPEIFVFDIFDIDEQRYADPDERAIMLDNLTRIGAKVRHVPIIALDVTLAEIGCDTLEGMLEFVMRKSLNHSVAEGCVFKSMDGTKSFKCINNEFLLQEK